MIRLSFLSPAIAIVMIMLYSTAVAYSSEIHTAGAQLNSQPPDNPVHSQQTSPEQTWYGADVQIDTLGDAALVFGNVELRHSGATIPIPLDPEFLDAHPGADEGKTLEHPGASEGNEKELDYCRSVTFPLNAGDLLSAAVDLISDPRSLQNLSTAPSTITFDVTVINATTGEILATLYSVVVGGGGPSVMISPGVRALRYDGFPVDHAALALTAHVMNCPQDNYGIEGLVVHRLQPLGKQVAVEAAPRPICSITPSIVRAGDALQFSNTVGGHAILALVGIDGRIIQNLFDGEVEAGTQTRIAMLTAIPQGVYIVRLVLDGAVVTSQKLIVLK